MSDLRRNLQAMLERGEDNALLRLSLGNACARDGDVEEAIRHLHAALAHDSQYSAAWKALGQVLRDAGRSADAASAWRDGIAAADARGDRQAQREMEVFLRRLERAASGGEGSGG